MINCYWPRKIRHAIMSDVFHTIQLTLCCPFCRSRYSRLQMHILTQFSTRYGGILATLASVRTKPAADRHRTYTEREKASEQIGFCRPCRKQWIDFSILFPDAVYFKKQTVLPAIFKARNSDRKWVVIQKDVESFQMELITKLSTIPSWRMALSTLAAVE